MENKNESEPPYPMIKAKLRELIWGLYCQGYDNFYVNCEYGIPLWVAEFITALKLYNDITLNIVVPYEEQSVKWAEEYRDRYFSVHEKADSVILASTQYHPECYRTAEKIMIDKSELLIICGKETELSDTYKYAGYQDVKVIYYPVS